MDCQESKSLISAYIDEQLEPAKQAELKQHFAECQECQATVRAEQDFRDFARDIYRGEKAPVQLRARVRKRLASGETKSGLFAAIFTKPRWIAATALTALLLSFVGIQIYKMGGAAEGSGVFHVQDLYGRVECIGCYYTEIANAQSHCSDFGHTLALLTDTRDVYSFIPNEKSIEIQPDLMHTQIKITGWVFYQANFIEIENYSVEEPAVAFLAVENFRSYPEGLSF